MTRGFPRRRFGLLVLSVLSWITGAVLRGEGERELRAAVDALARTSYTWETTARLRFQGETAEPRLNPSAVIVREGRVDPATYAEAVLRPSRDVPVPVRVVFRGTDVVALTPLGWQRRSEIRGTPGPDRDMTMDGQTVRLSRVSAAALQLMAVRLPADELLDLVPELKSCRTVNGAIVGELRDRTVEEWWGDARAKSAPEIQGTVIFKLNESGLAEYHFVLAIGFPNSRTKTIAWSVQQWSTHLRQVGSTTVSPPDAAIAALDR